MTNAEGNGGGNDAAFDNIRILDVTPQLDKAFSPTLQAVGQASTLTWTITNTTDLASKLGWSFTDNLPDGLTVASPSGAATTCTNGVVTGAAGAASVSLRGDLNTNQASCTLSVQVVAAAGTYQNCAANTVNLIGVNPPACATVEFADPTYTVAKTAAPSPAKAGDKVTFTVVLTNTSTVPVTNTTVTDNLSGVIDDATFNNDQSDAGAGGAFTYTAPNLVWTGTIPVGTPVTITYSATVGSPPGGDKTLNNVVTAPDSTNCKPGSGDPRCKNQGGGISLLDIKKVPGSVTPKAGETVVYTVTLTNGGSADYTGATFADNLSGVIDDATFNNDQSDAGAGGAFTYTAPNLSWTGTVPAGGTVVTVTYSVTVGNPPGGDKVLTNGVLGPVDSNCGPGSTDPDCGGTPPVGGIPLLVVVKQPDKTTPAPGDKVTYTVTLTNDGSADYTGATFTDNLTDVIDDATFNNDQSDAGAGGTFAYAAPSLTWTGTVPDGATVTITYSATVNTPPGGNKQLGNKVTSTIDTNCAPGSADPRCGGTGGIPEFKIVKTAAPNTALPGDTVTYTVTMTNPGTATNPNAQFTDNLSGVIDDATYNNDAADGGAGGTIGYTTPNLSWAGTIPAGGTVTVTYTVTVNDPPGGDKKLANAVTSTTPGSNCPPGNTDPDCMAEPPGVPHLLISKTVSPAEPAAGSEVTYTMTVTNDGGATYHGAVLSDDMTGVIDDATYNNDAADGGAGGTIGYTAPTLTWTGNVAAGQTVTITYSVTVGMPPAGDKILNNAVTTPPGGDCQTVVPGGNNTAAKASLAMARPANTKRAKEKQGKVTEAICTSPPAPIKSLTINKVASASQPKPGDKVTYTVTLANTGAVDYTGTDFTDDLTDVIDDATFNNDQSDNSAGGTFTYTAPKLAWLGNIAVGETVTLTYSATVSNPPTGNLKMKNKATSSVPGSSCPPGTTNPACGTGNGDNDGIQAPLPVTGASTAAWVWLGGALVGLGALMLAGLRLTARRKLTAV